MMSRCVVLGLLVSPLPSCGWSTPKALTPRLNVPEIRSPTALYNSNVVLRPSTDPKAFDSYRIGTARVHRYIRDASDASSEGTEAEYVMWYHGRPAAFDSENALPPLSTGRIGRATSRNGLHWERTVEGSLSEDAPDVSLGLNKESWWGFDTAHVGLGQVLLPMSTPAVMAEGGVYLMYYMGGSHEETPIVDYLENASTTAAKSDAKIKGMKLKIGVALSQDGMSWGRVEGDDPSGAIMVPYDEADPNTKSRIRDDDDSLLTIDEELYCGWPEVVVNQISEEESEAGSQQPNFFMYYSTMTKKDKVKCIACAVSPDGFRWMKRGVCLRPDPSGLDAGGCARCNVVRRADYDEETGRWTEREGWTMFYEGVSKEDGKHRVLAAESDDGRVWKKTGLILDVGNKDDGAWDCNGVGSPHVLRLDDGTLRMYYTGQGDDGSTAIGVARCKDMDSVWMREQAQFSFA